MKKWEIERGEFTFYYSMPETEEETKQLEGAVGSPATVKNPIMARVVRTGKKKCGFCGQAL